MFDYRVDDFWSSVRTTPKPEELQRHVASKGIDLAQMTDKGKCIVRTFSQNLPGRTTYSTTISYSSSDSIITLRTTTRAEEGFASHYGALELLNRFGL